MSDEEILIQPVENPIICSPYREPDYHWLYDLSTGIPQKIQGRRPASYWFKSEEARAGSAQMRLLAEENREDLPMVNALREDVRRWRESSYENASQVTKQLLGHWSRLDRARRLFFCQIEAVETIIYLREILAQGRTRRGKASLTQDDYQKLMQGLNPRPNDWVTTVAQPPRLIDIPANGALPLTRYGCKMATGSGKTVVMAMLMAWAFCNRGRVPGNTSYPRNALVVCPNLTIKERLQVLRPEDPSNYYDKFDLVPSSLRPELAKGKVLVTNWHAFNPESAHAEGGRSFIVVNKGEESPEAFARNRLGDLYEGEPIMVMNDEGHHAYRPRAVGPDEALTAEERAEREEATVWVTGLDKINSANGIRFCVDLSATPFYIGGSGFPEGSPFPWIVSDFALVDAIESGITKIPRLPAIDNTGRPDPKYFKLWEHINRKPMPGERLSGGKLKPEVVYRKAQDALLTLAGQWKERYDVIQQAQPGADRTPPVMIIVCDNTNLADHFHRMISGEEVVAVEEPDDLTEADADDADAGEPVKKRKEKTHKVYGAGQVFPELLANLPGNEVTIRIDSNLLAQAESADPNTPHKEAAEQLRKVVGTVGKPGEPGEKVRCVVSVNMLSEGWDANNVTNILGLRAFGSQLLCEQVVGRGLRRMDYSPDENGMLKPEYVDIYGVPFSLIPFKGRAAKASTGAEDRPVNEVLAVESRKALEIRFPIVEGYTVALRHNIIRCDVGKTERIVVDPWSTPTAVFVRPQMGDQVGNIGQYGGFEAVQQDRGAYYQSTHPQTIEFEIARQVVRGLTDNLARKRRYSRAQLFPQVLRIVQAYIRAKVTNSVHPCEIGLETYASRIVGILLSAIEPDDQQGEPPIIPILNRYKQTGSTAEVHFKTIKPVQATTYSHLNYVACDTRTWEQAAMFQLESLAHRGIIQCYARNERLEFNIPYELFGYQQTYVPDFLVRIRQDYTLVLEVKGQMGEETSAKHQAAQRWCKAVNHWGRLGRWAFLACWNPQTLGGQISAA